MAVMRGTICLSVATALTFIAAARGQNLIANGDFGLGNMDFTSDYRYAQTWGGPGDYTVASDPHAWNQDLASFGDHTTGSGLMMIVDGATQQIRVWHEDVPVVTNTEYTFGAWAASAYVAPPADLRVLIGGVVVGSDLTLPSQTGQWVHFTAPWNSGSATLASIEIVDLNTVAFGNDFVLDDISLTPEPASAGLLALGALALIRRRR